MEGRLAAGRRVAREPDHRFGFGLLADYLTDIRASNREEAAREAAREQRLIDLKIDAAVALQDTMDDAVVYRSRYERFDRGQEIGGVRDQRARKALLERLFREDEEAIGRASSYVTRINDDVILAAFNDYLNVRNAEPLDLRGLEFAYQKVTAEATRYIERLASSEG